MNQTLAASIILSKPEQKKGLRMPQMEKSARLRVYDFDGVLNEALQEKLSIPAIQQVLRQVRNSEYVAINTGRGFEQLEKIGLPQYLQENLSESELARVVIVTEKGGCRSDYRNGVWETKIHGNSTAADIVEKLEKIPAALAIEDAHIAVVKKKTFFSFEVYPLNPAEPPANWDERRAEILKLLGDQTAKVVEGKSELRMDKTTIAIDVEPVTHGKDAGARLIDAWTQELGIIRIQDILCYGDSKSDLDMARQFHRAKLPTTFIWTGKAEQTFTEEGYRLINASADGRIYESATFYYNQQCEAVDTPPEKKAEFAAKQSLASSLGIIPRWCEADSSRKLTYAFKD